MSTPAAISSREKRRRRLPAVTSASSSAPLFTMFWAPTSPRSAAAHTLASPGRRPEFDELPLPLGGPQQRLPVLGDQTSASTRFGHQEATVSGRGGPARSVSNVRCHGAD